jgi:hypothetical protein
VRFIGFSLVELHSLLGNHCWEWSKIWS